MYSDIKWDGRVLMVVEDKVKVVMMWWWWVCYVLVCNDGGNIYGQSDLFCDISDVYVFNVVVKVLF